LDHQTVQAVDSLNLQNFITCDLWPHLLIVFRWNQRHPPIKVHLIFDLVQLLSKMLRLDGKGNVV